MNQVRVRYGPSPTGIPHIGNIRTALYNYLYAKNQKGKFLLRIEDTDQARIVPGAVEKIKASLEALNLNWDEQITIQSQRLDIYQKHLEILKNKKFAYLDDGAWRYKINTKNKSINWEDLVHGRVEFPTNVLEDFIIVKSDKFPTYHFASVIDDHLMNVTHVLRGDEWISSTPKHLQLYEAFGWQPPRFSHLPPIVGADKKKLSKREGAKSVLEYIEEGYLPEAIINFLALLGWSPKGDKEVFSLDELCREFSLERINKNSPIFNLEKLNWFNGQWIRKISDAELATMIQAQNPKLEKSKIIKVLPVTKDRINNVSDFSKIAGFFFQKPNLKKHIKDLLLPTTVLQKLKQDLSGLLNWKEEEISAIVAKIMQTENLPKAQMYRSIGVALTDELVTPPIFASMEILGKQESLARLDEAIKQKSK